MKPVIWVSNGRNGTLMFSDERKIDTRFVCPKERARSVYWKKWAAKHGYEE